jgi:ActR/RegA family two-component response regulator
MIRALLTGRDRGVIDADDLQFDPDPEAPKVKGRKFPPETIQRALKSVGNNKSRAAATLGCSRKTIQRNVLLAIE